jgi:death-on-curing protein
VRHYRVTWADAVFAHEAALQEGGGRAGILNRDMVLSAIGRPYIGYNRFIYQKAAALFQSIACNHGFNDGQKRTAIIVTSILIEKSGYQLRSPPGEDKQDAIEALAEAVVLRTVHLEELAAWFKARLRRK